MPEDTAPEDTAPESGGWHGLPKTRPALNSPAELSPALHAVHSERLWLAIVSVAIASVTATSVEVSRCTGLIRGVLAVAAAGALCLASRTAAIAAPAFGASAAAARPRRSTATPIQHLVVIFEENVSFDHYFGTYPNAANTDGQPVPRTAGDAERQRPDPGAATPATRTRPTRSG